MKNTTRAPRSNRPDRTACRNTRKARPAQNLTNEQALTVAKAFLNLSR